MRTRSVATERDARTSTRLGAARLATFGMTIGELPLQPASNTATQNVAKSARTLILSAGFAASERLPGRRAAGGVGNLSLGMLLDEVGCLALAFVLSAVIGAEREFRGKAAGLRTYTIVGLSAALFTLCSKYGFAGLPRWMNHALPEPTRVASMIVTGIGFIGAGVIFVDRQSGTVEGLTTAAILWLTAAVGMAAGAGLWHLALIVTALHLLVCFGLRPIEQWLSDKGMKSS